MVNKEKPVRPRPAGFDEPINTVIHPKNRNDPKPAPLTKEELKEFYENGFQ